MQKSVYQPKFLLLFVLILVTIVGGLIRIQPVLASSFPLNDGALFDSMAMDLKENGFAIPLFTTYNHAEIPFAYPPFAFYFTAFLSTMTAWGILDIIRILPAVVSTLAIPAFFLLARTMLDSDLPAALATAVFAFLPRTFDWLIMGGGITRSFGWLFAILALWQGIQFAAHHERKHFILFVLLSALVVYSHPEATIHLGIGMAVFWLVTDRSRKSFFYFVAAIALVSLLTAPWWGIVIRNHGLAPFQAASAASRDDSYNPLVGLIILFRYTFTDEPFTAIFASVGLIGFFRLLAQKKYLLPLWFFFAHFFEPRGGTLYMMLPLALAAGVGLAEVILPALNFFDAKERRPGWAASILLVVLFFYGVFSANSVASKILNESTLTAADLAAFDWVKSNTAPDSSFLIITGENALRDPTSEWFPTITSRRSQATVFGYEWISDGKFAERTKRYAFLQGCVFGGAGCLEQWSQDSGLGFKYVYIKAATDVSQVPLVIYLQFSKVYKKVYTASKIAIFEYSELPNN